jgi:superfamily I DNA and RNA helicase
MSLEVVYGASRDRHKAVQLADKLADQVSNGTIYLGYPVLASADDRVEIHALLVSQEHGLVAFLLADSMPALPEEWEEYVNQQDRLYAILDSNLGRHDSLRHGRHLSFAIQTITVFANPIIDMPSNANGGLYCDMSQVADLVSSLPALESGVEPKLQAALQRVTTIKPAKKRSSVQQSTRGGTLKNIERGIANLDRWQKAAAIETPEGPQRIRGLAGSGKTVVLALKAAYLHAQHPDWRIVVTFHSRALYQQFSDLITRFSFEHSNDTPDPLHLQILHSWGSRSRIGVYSEMATALDATPRDYSYAQSTFGIDNAFQGICQELLALAKERDPSPIFDVVLIDEAQDLPPEFFQLVYLFTKDPKRIVWGFDELQKLSESAMPSTDELFGVGDFGESLVSLETPEKEPRRDIVLPVCYRNTPWALATAHALGFGIYRNEGLIQHFDNPRLWEQIGYSIVHGNLSPGGHVALQRSTESYPSYFDDLIPQDDAIVLKKFSNETAQDEWVAKEITKNVKEDELEYDDILIVLPDVYRAKSRGSRLIKTLFQHGIRSHLVGVGSSVDEVFVRGSVAVAHIFRAKGNEAPMVYVLDSQHASEEFNIVTRRNTLFTAITRSRAWVRILGWGAGMDAINQEVEAVRAKGFKLEFQIPTAAELVTLRHVHRDRSDADEDSVRRATEGLQTFIDAYERNEIDFYDLPPALRTRLVSRIKEDLTGDNN